MRTDFEIEQMTEIPVLAAITTIKGNKEQEKLVALHHKTSPTSEAFRMLRANLDFSALDKPLQTLLITSSGAGEGKTTLISNLAVVMAQNGRRVILVDADLRKPMIHNSFTLHNDYGLTSVIRHDRTLKEALQPTEQENLSILTSGPIPPNPAELLGSQRMEALVDDLRNEADVVLFDSPPVLAVVDANLLTRLSDATLLVVLSGSTRSRMLLRTRNQLAQVSANLVGTVVNQVPLSRYGYDHYYYYYATDTKKKRRNRRKQAAQSNQNGHHPSDGTEYRSDTSVDDKTTEVEK